MTRDEFDAFVEANKGIEWAVEGDTFLFRDTNLDWYLNDPGRCTSVTKEKLATMTDADLLKAIRQGLEVEQMTRITGYLAKISSFNPGKIGELKDRRKTDLEGRQE